MITFKVYCVEYNVSLKLISSISCHFLNFIIYLFLAVLGIHCCAWAFSGCGEQGLLSSCSVQASHRSGLACCGARTLEHRPQVAVVHGLSCGIFLDHALNPCPLHWQADS